MQLHLAPRASYEALGSEHHHGDKAGAKYEHPVCGKAPQDLREYNNYHCPKDCAGYAPHASKHNHCQDKDRLKECEALRRNECKFSCKKYTSNPCPECAKGK